MSIIAFPKINGVQVSYAQMQVFISGLEGVAPLQVLDVQSLDYSDKVDTRFLFLSSSFPLARYSRTMEAEGAMDLGLETHRSLVGYLTGQGDGGIMDVAFDIALTYQLAPGSQLINDVLWGCRLKTQGQRNTVGGKHLTTSTSMTINYIEWNGNSTVAQPTL